MSESDKTTEESILDAAEQAFLEKGYAATTTTEIAKIAKVNHAMLHYYFRTKENIFNKIFEAKARILTDSFIGVFEQKLSLEEKIIRSVGQHFDFLVKHPKLPMFIMQEILSNEEQKEKVKKMLLPKLMILFRNVQKIIDEESEKGNIRSTSAVTVVLNAVSLNVFSIVFAQTATNKNGDFIYGDKNDFLQQRRENNIQVILKSLEL